MVVHTTLLCFISKYQNVKEYGLEVGYQSARVVNCSNHFSTA